MSPDIITDIVVIGVILVSGLLALFQGFVKEVLSIASWVGALVVTIFGYAATLPVIKGLIDWPGATVPITIGVLFIGSLILFSIAAHFVSKLVHSIGIGPLDRTLGFVFGLVRGVLIVMVLYIFASYFVAGAAEQPRWFANARTMPLTAAATAAVASILPKQWRDKLPTLVKPAPRAQAPTSGTTSTSDKTRPGYPETDRRGMDRLMEGVSQGN